MANPDDAGFVGFEESGQFEHSEDEKCLVVDEQTFKNLQKGDCCSPIETLQDGPPVSGRANDHLKLDHIGQG